jgi:hypothetical protein
MVLKVLEMGGLSIGASFVRAKPTATLWAAFDAAVVEVQGLLNCDEPPFAMGHDFACLGIKFRHAANMDRPASRRQPRSGAALLKLAHHPARPPIANRRYTMVYDRLRLSGGWAQCAWTW